MKYQSFTGIGKRENNEDVILIEKFSQEVELYLVVDGMGGYEKGEVSARLVAENISTHLRTVEIINKTEINNAIKKANLAVKQFNESNKIASGATVAGIVFKLDIALCFWLGDVQIYHFLNGNLDWQSKGHTLLNEFLETDANRSPEMQKRYGHIVTKSVAGKREKSTPEILEIKNIQPKLPKLVEFSSSHFIQKQNETTNTTKGSYRIEKTPEEPAIDDLQEASSDKGTVIIKSEPVLLSFQQPIRTAKRYIKLKGMNKSYGEERDTFDDPDVVATDEPSILGTLGQGEFMGLADDLQYLEYYSEGLTAFKEMIIGLNESKVIVLDSEDPHYHRLPKVGKSRLHYTHKDQPRTLLEFRFKYQDRASSIFEIDLDDRAKSISTLIIQWN